jgi:ribonucleoside-diphosphate reductase alpha chain
MQDRNKYQYYFIIPNRIQEFIMANLEKDSDDYKRMVEFSGSVLDEDGSIGKEYIKIIDRNLPKGFFKPSHDIDYNQKVKLMARLYEWMESSISCTFNLPKTSTVQDVKNIYMAAYDHKVRAVSVYVDGSREGILVTEFPQETSICTENRPVDICYNCAPKRPKELPCNIHQVSVKGERWVVLVGMFNDKPFEIFCGAVEDIYLPQKCNEGSIVKQGNGKYSLKVKIRNSDVVYEDIADVLMSDNEKALTRLLSLNLRHGVYIQFIVDQLKKSKGNITSFSTAISRVLGKYVIDYVMKDNTCPLCGKASLSFDEGCIKCLECGYSRCD